MTIVRGILCTASQMALCVAVAAGGETTAVYPDAANDAALRRTDAGADGAINPDGIIPELIESRIMGWQSPTPLTDPYAGTPREGRGAHLFRVDMTFAGLLNPPGPLGAGGTTFNPYAFGPSPVYGFFELDIDRNENSGGELGSAAHSRYLANVSRFGKRPYGDVGDRAAQWSNEVDSDFYTLPQIERSGGDWAITLCGCHNVTVVTQGGNGNGVFDAGETWVVRSRFFKRAGGYQAASGMIGGSQPGLYDPYTNLRFSHEVETDRTTVTLVWAVDAEGASELTGQPVQAYDQVIGGTNHASIAESLRDLMIGAAGGNGGPLSGPVATLTNNWADESLGDDNLTDPTRWEPFAIFGMPYATSDAGAFFVWTDTGFNETFGDCNGDDLADSADQAILQTVITSEDGGGHDLDSAVNGIVTVGTGDSWSYFDLDSNGVIDNSDIDLLGSPCLADWDGDGTRAVPDIFAFLSAWFAQDPASDVDGIAGIAVPDIFFFLSAWFAGCP